MNSDDSAATIDVCTVATEVSATLGTGRQIEPFSTRLSAFGLGDSYRVAARVREMREACGERATGRKIGFTNRTVWAYEPAWGYIYVRAVVRYTNAPLP